MEGLLEVAVMVRVWVVSLDGPGLKPMSERVCRPLFSRIVTLVKAAKVGGLLTFPTVTRNELVTESIPPLAVPPLSWTTTVMVAVPNWVVAGLKVRVPVGAGLVELTEGLGMGLGVSEGG